LADLESRTANRGAEGGRGGPSEYQQAQMDRWEYERSKGEKPMTLLDEGRLLDRYFGGTSAGGRWTPGTALGDEQFDMINPTLARREWMLGREAGTLDPFSQAAADSLVRANLFRETGEPVDIDLEIKGGEFIDPGVRDKIITRARAIEKIREQVAEADDKGPDYAGLKGALIKIGMSDLEARHFLMEMSGIPLDSLPSITASDEDAAALSAGAGVER
jgi:hypothetical protein